MTLAGTAFTEKERLRLLALAKKLDIPVPPHMLHDSPTAVGEGIEQQELTFTRRLLCRLLEIAEDP